MYKINHSHFHKSLKQALWPIFITGGLALAIIFLLGVWYDQHALPGVYIAGEPVGNLTVPQIKSRLSQRSDVYQLHLFSGDQEWALPLSELGWQVKTEATAWSAVGLNKYFYQLTKLITFQDSKVDLPILYILDEEKLKDYLAANISASLDIPAIEPSVQVIKSDAGHELIAVYPGSMGQLVDQDELCSRIKSALSNFPETGIVIPVNQVDLQLSQDQEARLRDLAAGLLNKHLTIIHDDKQIFWSGSDLVTLLNKSGDFNEEKLRSKISNLATEVDHPASNAVFEFDPETRRVKEFQPESAGLTMEQDKFFTEALESLRRLSNEATSMAELKLNFQETPAPVKIDDLNELGIKTLLGKGVSRYKGSIPGRRHNVALGANRLKGVLVKPGERFSFNQQVGEVSGATGYQQAYVIRRGQTVLDDGGGICQVSTTVFRAALNAGLPILQRKAHAYRVGYYEQDSKPGMDATVYNPSADFVFLNDTPAHILLQTTVDEKNSQLTMELFGTDDGRNVEISKPRIWDVGEPPPDLYADDPTLPIGTIKQIEHKAWGAKTAFDWKVTRGEEVLQQKSFYSNYKPWGAVFVRGTKAG